MAVTIGVFDRDILSGDTPRRGTRRDSYVGFKVAGYSWKVDFYDL